MPSLMYPGGGLVTKFGGTTEFEAGVTWNRDEVGYLHGQGETTTGTIEDMYFSAGGRGSFFAPLWVPGAGDSKGIVPKQAAAGTNRVYLYYRAEGADNSGLWVQSGTDGVAILRRSQNRKVGLECEFVKITEL